MQTPSMLMLLLALVGGEAWNAFPDALHAEGSAGSHSFGRRLQQAGVLVQVRVGNAEHARVQLDSRLHAWVVVDNRRFSEDSSRVGAFRPALGRHP